MDESQKKELEIRNKLHENGNGIVYDSTCPVCGKEFVLVDENYEVDGVKYPIITNHSTFEGAESWNEDHMCPACKVRLHYSDNT